MATITIEEGKLKDLIKTALIDVLENRRDLIQAIIEETLEDQAFSQAIKEGMASETVSRAEVFEVLESKR